MQRLGRHRRPRVDTLDVRRCARRHHHPHRDGGPGRHDDPVDRREHVDRLGGPGGHRAPDDQALRAGAPRDQALRAGQPAHRTRHRGHRHATVLQRHLDRLIPQRDLRVRGLGHRQQLGRQQRRQVTLHHHSA
jgi:hypothetical protein